MLPRCRATAAAPRLASVQLKPANQEDLVQPSATIATHAGGRAKLRKPAVVGSIAALIAVVLISSTAGSNVLDWLLVIDGFVAASWWALSRHRQPDALQVLSLGALLLAIATLAGKGVQWQLVPWQVLAGSVAAAAAFRRWRPGHSRRWRRAIGRGVLVIGLALGGLALLTAFVPALPKPSGPHQRRQRDLPLDRQPASRNAHRQPVRPPAGHRPSLVPDRHLDRSRSPVLRGAAPPSGSIERTPLIHVRLVRPRRDARHPRHPDQPRAANLARAAALARAGDPTRAIHRSLRRPRKPRLRGHRPQRPVRISGHGARRRARRRANRPIPT